MTSPTILRLSGSAWDSDSRRPSLHLWWENGDHATTEALQAVWPEGGSVTMAFSMKTKPELVDLFVEQFPKPEDEENK